MDSSPPTTSVDESKPADFQVGSDRESLKWPGHMCAAHPKAPLLRNRYNAPNAMLANSNLLWDNGKDITFCFIKPSGVKLQRDKVLATIKEWEKYANIKFKLVEKPASAMIRVAFDVTRSPSSLVGREVEAHRKEFTVPTLNLGPVVRDTQTDMDDEERGTILHEFGHALGFLHEHQSIRMGETIKMYPNILMDYFTSNQQGWSPEQVETQILRHYDEKDVSNYSAVDIKSVMIYFMPSNATSLGKFIRPNPELSEKDKAFAFLNYPFLNGKVSPDREWNISKALKAVGAEGEWRQRLLAKYELGNWKSLRSEFTYFCMEERARALADIAASEETMTHSEELKSKL